MKQHGNKYRDTCPVCSRAAPPDSIWKIPFSRVEQTQINGAYLRNLPMLDEAGQLYCYTQCSGCESIFLNPYDAEDADRYKRSTFHAGKFAGSRPSMTGGFQTQFDVMVWPRLQEHQGGFLDAACGAGQYLFAALDHGYPGRLVGIDLAEAALSTIAQHGGGKITTQQVDLSEPNSCAHLGMFDFIAFCEAFEHVEYPRNAIHSLANCLNSGGRLFFTAQAPGGGLPIRPEEPIYSTERGVLSTTDSAKLIVEKIEMISGRWKVLCKKK